MAVATPQPIDVLRLWLPAAQAPRRVQMGDGRARFGIVIAGLVWLHAHHSQVGKHASRGSRIRSDFIRAPLPPLMPQLTPSRHAAS